MDFGLLRQTTYGMIGVKPISPCPEEVKEVVPDTYATFEVKRLTKANSFIIMDEVFYIAKKSPNDKAASIHFVYRASDMRLVTASPRSKEETIALVKRKWFAMDL